MEKNINEKLQKLAANDGTFKFRINHETGAVSFLRGDLGTVKRSDKGFKSALAKAISEYRDLFGIEDERSLKMIRTVNDIAGGQSAIFQQFHGDALVEGGNFRIHVSEEGVLDSIGNGIFPDLEKVERKPKVSEKDAWKAAVEKIGSKELKVSESGLVVIRHKKKPVLTWKFRTESQKQRRELIETTWLAGEHGGPSMWVAYVDANSGEVVNYYDDLKTATIIGTGTGYYAGPGQAFNVEDQNAVFELQDNSRVIAGGPQINSNDEDGTSPSTDSDNNWVDLGTSPRHNNQGAEVDTHIFATDALDYFDAVHGRNSIDDAGVNVNSVVHYGNNTNNAYWNGTSLLIGDGSGAAPGFDYLCSDDVVAHELAHGVTEFTCALAYQYESGALNEAFSDIFAAFITNDWLIGEGPWLKTSAPALRNMIDPTNGGLYNTGSPIPSVIAGHQPAHYSQRYIGWQDNGGVHINSGIINHLFYLLTVGGSHAVSGEAVTAIGQAAAEALLYQCMTAGLVGNPNATFLDFREAMLDAVLTLFPGNLFILSQVKNAFNASGIGPDIFVRDNVNDTGVEPSNTPNLWDSPDIINRISASSNPALDFANLANGNLWQNAEFGQDNFVYIRLQNRGPETGDATVQVFLSPATSFGVPASWIPVGTAVETNILPGSLRIASVTLDQATIPGLGHYCFIAVVSSSLDPEPGYLNINSVNEFYDYVSGTNNIAWRNMDIVDSLPNLAPIHYTVRVDKMPGEKELFDLDLELGRMVPGARMVVRGPENVLRGANVRGMKVIREKSREDVAFEVLPVDKRIAQQDYLKRKCTQLDPGFERVLVQEPFDLKIEIYLPEAKSLQRIRPGGYQFRVVQSWDGKPVGSAGLRFPASIFHKGFKKCKAAAKR